MVRSTDLRWCSCTACSPQRSVTTCCAARWGARRRVIAIDQRGHGESDHAADYAWERWVGDLQLVVEALDLDRRSRRPLHGRAATRRASRRCIREVRRLALLDGGFGPTNSPDEPEYWRRVARLFPSDGFESLADYVDLVLELFPRAARSILEESTGGFARGDDGRWRWPMQADLNGLARRCARTRTAIERPHCERR